MQKEQGAITRRIVDIFKEAPSEGIPEDSLDDLINHQYIDKAITLVGEQAFNKLAEEKSRSLLLSRRGKKKKTGSAKPLDQRSVQIATAVGIIIKHDQKNPRDSQP